jgi:hypothetical protein
VHIIYSSSVYKQAVDMQPSLADRSGYVDGRIDGSKQSGGSIRPTMSSVREPTLYVQ